MGQKWGKKLLYGAKKGQKSVTHCHTIDNKKRLGTLIIPSLVVLCHIIDTIFCKLPMGYERSPTTPYFIRLSRNSFLFMGQKWGKLYFFKYVLQIYPTLPL